MLLILPPSETKRDGGDEGAPLDLSSLRFPELSAARIATVRALAALSRNVGDSMTALGLGPTQRSEIDRNRVLSTAPTMSAIDRYTGVLYDALDAASLSPAEREWVDTHVVIHSALFGLVSAADPVPAYRLSHDSRLPGLRLKAHWRADIAALLEREPGFILDLRSESYAALGPLPVRDGSWYLRVVSVGPNGQRKALTHFNKKGKGEFVRALAQSNIDHRDADSLIEWAGTEGIALGYGTAGELELTV